MTHTHTHTHTHAHAFTHKDMCKQIHTTFINIKSNKKRVLVAEMDLRNNNNDEIISKWHPFACTQHADEDLHKPNL